MIQKWVEQGTAEGDPADLSPKPKFVEGWRLGEPDMILKAEKPLVLPPQGTDMYWNFIFRVPIKETRWVKAIEIRPGDRQYVHHANLLVDREETSRRREAEPGAGFGGMEIRIESLQLGNDIKLDIPAGEKNFVVTDTFRLPIDVQLLAIYRALCKSILIMRWRWKTCSNSSERCDNNE